MLIEPKLSNCSPDFGKPAVKQNHLLHMLGAPHVDSFNYMLEKGLSEVVKNLLPVHLTLASGDKVEIAFEDVTINYPTVPSGTIGVKNYKIYPSECRQRAATYKGKINAKISWFINGRQQETLEKCLGEVPIMLRSNRCHLKNLSPAELIQLKEHEQEWGGYFIIKGHERLIRMLLLTRRNYPIAIKRSGWKQRGDQFSDLGILLRSVKEDNTATNNSLHYVTDGSAKLMFTYRKVLYYVPLILMLKCLLNVSDKFIYNALTSGCDNDVYYQNCILNMMRTIHEKNLHTHEQCKIYIGKMFRIKFFELPANATDSEICDFLIKHCIAIHLDNAIQKFYLLCFMTKKLFALANNKCAIEGVDAIMMQECLLGGHLYLQVVKEKLYSWLTSLRTNIARRAKNIGSNFTLNNQEMINILKSGSTLDSQMENFLSTGNIRSQSGLGLMQNTGLSIVAENINRMRYMSHFRAIHRGSFFQEMRTTEVRQLLPDAWGFICPVHTPDGAPCGLLNHLTMNCIITKYPDPKLKNAVPTILLDLGMLPILITDECKNFYTVILDGDVIGLIDENIVTKVIDKLRILKISEKVPPTMEIVLIPKKNVPSQYPGIYLFTGPTRMMRPVKNLSVNKIELIGTFEQIYLNICITAEEAHEGLTTHQELSKTAFLSNLACLIPMPDCNQSPRNMYQCQMGKQTMGTPCLTWQQQSQTKLYRLQTPMTPLFRPVHYDNINLDEFAMGTNAIVAVISYTGYDMEDAMIINKASYERGLAHGMIYKSEFIELKDQTDYFIRDSNNSNLFDKLDPDGLPNPGTIIKEGDPYYCFFNGDKKSFQVGKYNGKEDVYVDNVKLCGGLENSMNRKACITFRIPRNPNVGDKFASRAGQKGICSQKWPMEDLPFTETGLIPDIVFNPHGFPSRMTIAMMIEVIAGKSAALHGLVHDATPFRFSENETAVDYFGNLLEQGGYNYYGTERMYSGIDGREMTANIFFGIVHYQRLRHMVSDKWQVRSTGPIDVLTRQPIKGRRRGGGVRFGEMERDSLISHGCSFLLQDRLFHCSDKTTTLVCKTCGTLIGPVMELFVNKTILGEKKMRCRLCKDNGNLGEIDIPYIFKYLVTQLTSCNINVKIAFNKK
ncbi:PREDICTED: DNA-directed RNA polymerase I subunit RPA2 [Ceratosolen solmsi marchali]|uniref:DNA-directed RNA polymerase subunit beta n=1 Tax=Ceratosolen solmsi marchali TaxID=326594 RepID=A0AAJ7DXG8_9HYME|nr:PREDICTED: DNA-directed RNA polymerase I subunit RPA2 [Ceratosolen solmsi marchali]